MKSLRRRQSRRAVALLTAMMVSLFLLVLTGALIQTQSGVFAMAQSSDARLRSRAACATLYDFCLYQIEHNREWGRGGFQSLAEVDPIRTEPGGLADLDSRVEIVSVEGNLFRGFLSEHNAGFQVEVVNALTNPAGAASLDGLATAHEQIRLRIAAWDGRDARAGSRSRQQVDCLLRLAPLYDGSVLSRGEIQVATQQALFASKDPFRNEIRGEKGVDLPGLTTGRTRFVKHDQTVTRSEANMDSFRRDSTGMLWAGGEITQDDAGSTVSSNPASLAQAAERSGGRLVSKANSRADIYDLKPENIPQPTFHDDPDPFRDRDIVVPPGEFRFTKAMATVHVRKKVVSREGNVSWQNSSRQEPVDVVEYYDPPSSARPHKVMRARTKSSDPSEEVLGTDVDYGADMSRVPVVVGDRFAVDDAFQSEVTTQDVSGNPVQAPEMGFREIGEAEAPVVIDLSRQTVTVLPETRVRPRSRPAGSTLPASAFELSVREGSGGTPTLPTFSLGTGNNDVVFEADGNISIGAGYTKGLGTIISKQGSVTLNPLPPAYRWVQKEYEGYTYWALEPDGEMEVSANEKYAGLVIYADKDVAISNLTRADWTFKGFVYARGNFDFDVNGQNTTFYGSVVAGNNAAGRDHFRIQNGHRATFIYDPDYLKLLTQQLPWNWTRVEPLIWSEGNG